MWSRRRKRGKREVRRREEEEGKWRRYWWIRSGFPEASHIALCTKASVRKIFVVAKLPHNYLNKRTTRAR